MMLHRFTALLATTLLLAACADGKPDQTAASASASAPPSDAASAVPLAAAATSAKPSPTATPMIIATPVGMTDADNAPTTPPSPLRSATPRDFEARGIYMTASSMMLPRYQTMMKAMVAAKGNMFVFDAKDEGGIVSWKSKVPLAVQVKADKEGLITDLKAKCDEAHKLGVFVSGRIVCFNDPILAKARPDLCVRRADGSIWKENGRQVWVDPSLKAVQDYQIALAKEMAAMGVDEVQFDYIRFPAQGDTQNARYAFDRKNEKKVPKHAVITGFLKRAYEELHPLGVNVSVDVYGIMAWAQPIDVKITGQLLEDMAHYTDAMCPMLYPSHFQNGFAGVANPADQPYLFMHKGLTLLNKKVAGSGVTVRPWMQAMPWKVSRFDANYIVQQLKAGRDCNAKGYQMWNAQNKFDTAFAGMRAFHGK